MPLWAECMTEFVLRHSSSSRKTLLLHGYDRKMHKTMKTFGKTSPL